MNFCRCRLALLLTAVAAAVAAATADQPRPRIDPGESSTARRRPSFLTALDFASQPV